jgi:hypothetical protein
MGCLDGDLFKILAALIAECPEEATLLWSKCLSPWITRLSYETVLKPTSGVMTLYA